MKRIWPFLALTAIILLFLGRGLTDKAVFFGADEINSDLLGAYAQHERLARDYFKKGRLPLWNPYVGGGIPAEAQLPTYSPMVILYILFSPTLAFNLNIILNFLLIGWGILLYGQKIGLGKVPAFFSALVFTLSGFMVGQLRHLFLESALISLPYLLLVTEEIITRKKFIWGIPLAFLVYLSLCFGHFPTTLFLLLFLTFYFLLRLSSRFKEENREDLRPVIIFFAGITLGVFLAAVILLPIFQQIQYSTRASFGMENSLVPPFKLEFFRLFLQPYAFGDPSRGTWNMFFDNFWENIGYLGILPLALAILGLVWKRKETNGWRKIFGLLALLAVLLLLGSWTPFYSLVWNWIPGFSFTRAPGRFLLYLDFALAILAGLGLKILLSKFAGKKRFLLASFIILVSIADLFWFGYHFNAVMPTTYFGETASVKFLRQDSSLYRLRALNAAETWYEAWREASGWSGDLSAYFIQRELVPEDNNLFYRLSSPVIMYGLSGRLVPRRPSELDIAILTQSQPSQTARLLGMENVKYLLSFDLLEENEGFSLAATIPAGGGKNVYLYQNQKWLPRAYLVKKAIYISKKEEVLNTILFDSFNPQEEVIVEQEVARPTRGGGGAVKIVSYEDSRVRLEVNSPEGGFLVLSDTYYPGWKAIVDGREQRILQANYNYRALAIESGEHQVVFSYQPFSVKLGQAISLVTLVLLLISLGYFLIKRI